MKLLMENFKKFLNEGAEPTISEGEGYETKVLDRHGNPVKKLHTWNFTLKDGSHPMSITADTWAIARAEYRGALRRQDPPVWTRDEDVETLNNPI